MGKGSQNLFKAVINEIWKDLVFLCESRSKVSYFVPDPRNFAEVTVFLVAIKRPWIKATLKEIKNLVNN